MSHIALNEDSTHYLASSAESMGKQNLATRCNMLLHNTLHKPNHWRGVSAVRNNGACRHGQGNGEELTTETRKHGAEKPRRGFAQCVVRLRSSDMAGDGYQRR